MLPVHKDYVFIIFAVHCRRIEPAELDRNLSPTHRPSIYDKTRNKVEVYKFNDTPGNQHNYDNHDTSLQMINMKNDAK